MTIACSSKFAAISAVHLMCTVLASGQERVNPQAETIAHLSERVTAYLSLQKKVEGGIRTARPDASPGDFFNGASEQFRQIIREDAKDRSVRGAFASMQEVPKKTPQAAAAAARQPRIPVHGP